MRIIKDQTTGDIKSIAVTRLDVIVGAIVTLLILFFVLCFRTVDAGNVGIVTRFGEINRVASSGVALKLPWPIERLEKMEIRVQKGEQDVAAATSDLQDVNAKLALNFALDNNTALKVYKELGKNYSDRVIVPALQESFKSASAKYTAGDLITKRSEVKAEAYKVIKARLEKYGIRVVDLNVVNFSFSPEFNTAIEAKQVAQQSAEKAKQDLARIEVEAQQRITQARGESEAQRLQQQTLTPELVRLREIEAQQAAIAKWNGVMPSTVAGDGTIFSIPAR